MVPEMTRRGARVSAVVVVAAAATFIIIGIGRGSFV